MLFKKFNVSSSSQAKLASFVPLLKLNKFAPFSTYANHALISLVEPR